MWRSYRGTPREARVGLIGQDCARHCDLGVRLKSDSQTTCWLIASASLDRRLYVSARCSIGS
jgi:hypothetical protein